MKDIIKIGTRKSLLALTQTNIAIKEIQKHFPRVQCEIIPITTTGDLIQNTNLYDIGGKALFLKEIEQALLNKEIDLAVHSLKDVPGRIPDNLLIDAMLEREDPRDVFICLNYKSVQELPLNSVIGTSSVRRRIFLKHQRNDLQIVTFRGNIDSRIKKLKNNEVDATILAYAGLKRANMFDPKYCHLIELDEMLPCIGQGVIALERREDDHQMQEICSKINHLSTWNLMQGEREFLKYLDADCRTPIAAYSQYIDGDDIQTDFMLGSLDKDKVIFHSETDKITNAKQLGIRAAEKMVEILAIQFQ